jgi:hypothetical protein
LLVGFEVPEFCYDLEAVVHGVAAASALTEDLPVFESGDDVFDTGPDTAMQSLVVVADDPTGLVWWWCGDRTDAAISTVAENDSGAVEQVGDGVWGDDDVVAVARPNRAGGDDAAFVGVDHDLGAAPVVLA